MASAWFAVFLASICLEGLGRKYAPAVPSVVFYFFKDVVLLVGYFMMRPTLQLRRAAKWLYRGFAGWWVAGFIWTVIEIFNPEGQSVELAIVGLRSYWLWWLAPIVVATSLQVPRDKRRAIYALLILSVGVALFANVQFASSPTSAVNLYSTVGGEEVYADVAIVSTTGRARVASTFSYVSGFSDFTVLVPTLLLSIGLETRDRKLRRFALIATLLSAAVLPMSGSRGAVLLGGAVLVITTWAAGLLFTPIGRRVVIGGIVAAVLATVAVPEALEGVQSRFADASETQTRLASMADVLPPVALTVVDYPLMGVGTGMQQNARVNLNISGRYEHESEAGRYLVELGPIGYLLVWISRLGLMIALLRAYRFLKSAGRRGAAAAAFSYAALTFFGNLTFDHIWQALFFMGCGFILAEVIEVQKSRASAAAAQTPPPAPRPIAPYTAVPR